MKIDTLTDEPTVLIIYTGGTIGMLVGQQGYVPEPHFLTETLRSQARFHDPLQNSLFSNAGSVQGFREWSTGSGRSSPSPSASPASATHHFPTLPVRSSRPIGVSLASTLSPGPSQQAVQPPIRCVKVAEDVYEYHVPSLVTPRSVVPGGSSKSIRYAILEVSASSAFSILFTCRKLVEPTSG